MTFIFISHLDCDKKRIKPITDRLLGLGWRLWIDRPQAMGYSPEDIEAWQIGRIIEGNPWLREIDRAINASYCTIFFASNALQQEAQEEVGNILRREIAIAESQEKLLIVRIDNIDLRALGGGFNLKTLQHTDIWLPINVTAAEQELDEINFLSKAIEEKFRQNQKEERGRRFGFFEITNNGQRVNSPTADQIDRFLMMMDREIIAQEISDLDTPLTVIEAYDSARPQYLKRRLAQVDLACRILSVDRLEQATFCDFRALRAELLFGKREFTGGFWTRISLPWPVGRSSNVRTALRFLVEAMIQRLGLSVIPRQMKDTDHDRLQLLRNALVAANQRIFVSTVFEDKLSLRNQNAALISDLLSATRDMPVDRFRFLVQAIPIEGRLFASKPTGRWLEHVLSKSSPQRHYELSELRVLDLEEWCDLMSLFVDMTAQDVGDAVASAFGQQRELAFRSLEERLRPIIGSWRVKSGRAQQPNRPREWGGGDA